MNYIHYESCLTPSINDFLKNGFWYKIQENHFYFFYDEDLEKISELFNISTGIKQPLVGNVIYNEESLWNLTELKRSYFISKNISVLTTDEYNFLKRQTVYQIFCEEISLANQKILNLKNLVLDYLKDQDLFEYKKIIFDDLDEAIKIKVIYAKLFYKKPKFIFLNFINWNNTLELKNLLKMLQDKILINSLNACFVVFYNKPLNLENFILTKIGYKKYYNSYDMAFTLTENNDNEHLWKYSIKNFFTGLWFFIKRKWSSLFLYFFIIFFWFIVTNVLWSIDFNQTFNLNFDLNLLSKLLSLLTFICLEFFVFWEIYKSYKSLINLISFFIIKGYNRIFAINFYLFIDLVLVFWSFIFSLIVNFLLKDLANIILVLTNIIWPIIIYVLSNCVILALHYIYTFKYYSISTRKISFFHLKSH